MSDFWNLIVDISAAFAALMLVMGVVLVVAMIILFLLEYPFST